MKKYPQMKDSSVKWLGEIPVHWNIDRGKRFFFTHKVKNDGNTEKNILSLTLRGVIRNNADKPIGLSPSDYSTYQIFEKDDLVFKLIDLNNISTSRVGLVPERGIMSSAYIRLTTRMNCDIKYFYLFYYHLWLRNIYNGLGAGVRQTLGAEDLLNLDVIVPPVDEQAQIVRFLDWKVSEISRLIALRKKQIEKLEELKRTVVSQAMTKCNGKTLPLKRCLNGIKDIDHYMPQSIENGYPYVMTGDLEIIASNIDFNSCKQIGENDYQSLSEKSKPEKGDVIFARYATIGTVCYVDIDKDFLVSYSCLTLKPNNLLIGKYLFYYLKSDIFVQEISQLVKINTQGNIGIDSLKKTHIVIPRIDEQQQIVSYLDTQTERLDAAITNKQQQIQTLQEFKTRLISDVVTGKIDVRGIEIPEYEYFSDTSEEETEDSDDEQEVDEA